MASCHRFAQVKKLHEPHQGCDLWMQMLLQHRHITFRQQLIKILSETQQHSENAGALLPLAGMAVFPLKPWHLRNVFEMARFCPHGQALPSCLCKHGGEQGPAWILAAMVVMAAM